jgi:nicotinamidase/pyrazinamidase
LQNYFFNFSKCKKYNKEVRKMIERTQSLYAVINVDIQNDFCPGGKLAVADGHLVVPVMNEVNEVARRSGGVVVFTRDFHSSKTKHFAAYASNGQGWPEHCVQGTRGALLHKDLRVEEFDLKAEKGMGEDEDAYSAFDARDGQGRMLDGLLKDRGVRKLIVGGLATDYCVKETVLDGIRKGYGVYVIENGVKAVDINPGDGDRAWVEMLRAGGVKIDSNMAERLLLSVDAFLAGRDARRRGIGFRSTTKGNV